MASSARKRAVARVGTLLDGKWTLDSFLGYGGSAAVYAATHRNGKRAAVKILHAHCAADADLVARFLREGYLANKIQHPGIVSVLDDHKAEDGHVYLVMDLLEGRSFEAHGRGQATPLSIVEGLQIADDLLDILVAAHATGLVHRDIKPGNLFLTSSGELKILDFGIARLSETFSEGVTQTGMLMGTPAYMPPEQARGRWDEVDARSDLWAVGVTLSTLMTGKRPRTADTPAEELLAAMMQPMPSLALLLPDAPPQVIALIDRAYAFERHDRWQSALQMQTAVREARQVLQGPAPFAPSTTLRFAPEVHPVPGASYGDGTPPPSAHGSYPPPAFGSTVHAAPVSRHGVHDLDHVPNLTTNRAMTSSSAPGSVPVTGVPKLAFVAAVIALLAVVGLVLIGVTIARARSQTASAAAPPPVVTPVLPPSTAEPAAEATALTPATVDTVASATATATTAAAAASTQAGDRKRDKRPRPKASPEGSADPNKYFDNRF